MKRNKVRFEVILDATGFSFKGPRGSKLTPKQNKDGTYHLIALPDEYQIANPTGPRRSAKKKTSGGTSKKKK